MNKSDKELFYNIVINVCFVTCVLMVPLVMMEEDETLRIWMIMFQMILVLIEWICVFVKSKKR